MSIYSKILSKTIIPLLLAREGQSSAFEHYKLFQKSQYWPLEKIQEYQLKKLQKLVKHCYANTVYYKNLMDEHGISPDSIKTLSDIKKFPVLTRDITFAKQEEFFAKGFDKSQLQQFTSGGTTGQYAKLFRDHESFNIKLAMAWRFESWMGKQLGDKVALVWPAAMDINLNEPFRTRFKNRYLQRIMIFNAGGLDEESLAYIHKGLSKFKPKFLRVFPSALFGYTEYCIEHNLKHPPYKGILSTGEPLSANEKKLFEQTYNCPVFDMYGSREVGNTSGECEKQTGMHLAMETLITEFVDENGQDIEHGKEGEIIVTDLTNYAFPLIRYTINDYGMPMKGTCSCGRELLRMDKALGRVSDIIYRPDGSKILGHVLGIAITFEGPPIGQSQIIQNTYTDFHVKITNKPKPTQEILDFIEREMKHLIGESINVTIEIVDEIPKEKSGKMQFVKCLIPRD